MHWRKNTSCRLRPATPFPASPEDEGAAAGWCWQECCHTALAGHTGTSPTPQSWEHFASFRQKAKEMGKSKILLHDCVTPVPQVAGQDTEVFIHPASECCNTDTHFQGAGDDFNFIY